MSFDLSLNLSIPRKESTFSTFGGSANAEKARRSESASAGIRMAGEDSARGASRAGCSAKCCRRATRRRRTEKGLSFFRVPFPHERIRMTSSVKSLVLVCMVILLAACSTTSSYSTHPSGDPVIAREARALGLSYLDAIEGAADCAAIGPRLAAAFADQSARIDLLANARVRFGEGPTKEEQSRLLKAAERSEERRGGKECRSPG